MIEIKLYLPDGRIVPAKIRERQYKKLITQLDGLSFWKRFKLLFIKK